MFDAVMSIEFATVAKSTETEALGCSALEQKTIPIPEDEMKLCV